MQAMIFRTYGGPDVLKREDVTVPPVGDEDVLVRIHAASANAADWHLLRGDPIFVRFMLGGLRRPKPTVLGSDMAGVVEAVGRSVTQFKPGDAVYGDLSSAGWGAMGEQVVVAAKWLAHKPVNVSFAEAAAAPMAAVTALQGLRKGKIQAGQRVLINGASGGVGSYAVQIAKALGAEVTAVCSTRNVENARSLGADHVIDYKQEDFTQNGQQYDLILAVNGNLPIAAYRRALTPTGTYIMTGGGGTQMGQVIFLGSWVTMTSKHTVSNVLARPNAADLDFVRELFEAGKLRSVIDRCYPLVEAADAIRYVETGHASGKVVVQVVPDANGR